MAQIQSRRHVGQRGLGARAGLLLAGLFVGVGCGEWTGMEDGFSDDEWEAIRQIEPLKTPQIVNPFNKYAESEDAAKLGRMLFMDPEFATAIKLDNLLTGKKGDTGKVACVTCHDPERSFVDTRPQNAVSHGTGITLRNSPAMVNLGWYKTFTWAGRMDSLSTQGANAPEAGTDVATTRLLFAHVAYRKYREEYKQAFALDGFELNPALDPMHPDAARFPPAGRPKAAMTDPDGPWEMMAGDDKLHVNQVMAYTGKAFEAYERKLVSANSRFQKYVKGDRGALNPQEKEGLRLFIGKASCTDCHTGPILSNNGFHNIGVPQAGAPAPDVDTGRWKELAIQANNPFNGASVFSDDQVEGKRRREELLPMIDNPSLKGLFRTPGLTNIEHSAPYFHNGSAKTLEDVVRFYNNGGGPVGTFSGEKDHRVRPLGLTSREQAALVAFLKSLTGEPPPAEWRDQSYKKM